jgi:curved DNA-binding protein CbpA
VATEPDAYRVLQVDPAAEDAVVHAAYRTLARRYHPDGEDPDPGRMSALNRAYALVRTPDLRRTYDSGRNGLRAVGPGRTPPAPAPPPAEDGVFARNAARTARRSAAEREPSVVLDFGRYMGWSVAQLARHDPDYLRWLARHSSGIRFRSAIRAHLGFEPDLNGRQHITA